jgi:triphosphoribosyl-dephospho-CoA synthase
VSVGHTLDIGAAAQLACLLEVSAPKPGNVTPTSGFDDATYEDFLASAAAIAFPLGSAASRPVGATIHLAVEATRRCTTANTNLGMVLLLAPLATAGALLIAENQTETISPTELRTRLTRVLADTTVEDARSAYAAIRLAAPGGLGSAPEQDVARDPTVTLTEAMRLASEWDGIAREYASGFRATFEISAPALQAARREGLDWNDAIVEAFLTLLATFPDTHIARRAGTAVAADVTRRAKHALEKGAARTTAGRAAVEELDAALRGDRNLRNPGTTADITAAAIFVALLAGEWHSRTGGADAARR